MKILLAEDEPISRRLMQRTLQQFGYEVCVAENGRKAAEILSSENGPRLALVDWMMPELDGPELCREVRARHHERSYVYIILLTSRQNNEDVVAGLESGADDYLVKPCAPAELKARLRTGRRILELEGKLVKAHEEMEYKATHDSLTGLINRPAILAFAQRSLQHSDRQGGKATLLVLCDVDHFKRLNDTFGHPVGDAVLAEVSQRLSSSVRGGDAVGRYGGEEFLIVISGCDRSVMARRCEDIRLAVSRTPILAGGMEIPVTVSVGAAVADVADEASLELVLAQSDAALYRAKAQGRNCAVLSDPDLVGAS